MAIRIVDVLVPVALDQAYSYRVPAGQELAPGDVVSVPLGASERTGVVWGEGNPRPGLHNKLKDVVGKRDVPPLRPELRRFVDWVANYTLGARGMVLRMTLRMGEHLGAARERVGVRLVGEKPQRMTAARAKVMIAARRRHGPRQERSRAGGGRIGGCDRWTNRRRHAGDHGAAAGAGGAAARSRFSCTRSHAGAGRGRATRLRETVAAGGFSATLIDGVTGSGKTEVYFEAVAENIRRGRQTLILMPEIALTAQFLDRFAVRFGVRPAEWHSQLSPRKRARTWAAVAAGEVSVVVGARSALFLPYADLGLIVVDEEHDPAYKQEDGVHYHARDMAVVRAHERGKFPLCWRRPRLRWRRKSMRAADATGACICPSGSADSTCRQSRPSICAAKVRRADASSRRGSRTR